MLSKAVEYLRPRKPAAPLLVYLILEGISALLLQSAVTIYVVFYATTVGLNTLQIVLFGTVFETTIFLFEVPTGIVADLYSRRLSIIVGVGLTGAAFLTAGLLPVMAAVLASEVISGIGATFMSGATEAWVTDEIGVERAGRAFVRGAQVKMIGAIIGTVVGTVLASVQLNLPFVMAGGLLLILAVILVIIMPENGFRATPPAERETWQVLFKTARQGIGLIRVRPALIVILTIAGLFALHTEGFDHLWQKHFLDNFTLPVLGTLKPVAWFGMIGLSAQFLSIGLSEIVRRRVRLDNPMTTAQALRFVYAITSGGIIVFALAGDFGLAMLAYCLVATLRTIAEPISKAWLNQHIEPSIRATMFSFHGQVHAFGEIIGGPPVGFIGQVFSLRAALAACGAVLTLTLPLFTRVLRGDTPQTH